MYCKNCGRQLKEGMRFCDRCGQSVRKNKQSSQSAKRQEIEELKAERLNRKKRLAEKEAKQVRVKKRKNKGGITAIFLIAALLIAVVSCIIGYNLMLPDTQSNLPISTDVPTATTAATQIPSSATAAPSKDGYTTITIGAITCPYPSDFHSNPVTGNEKLNLTDALGGATMIVSQEGKSGTATELMRDHVRQTGGTLTYNRAGDDWYAVTAEVSGTAYHRKCIIRNGIATYYDFSYNAQSASKQKYTEYIEYIDSNFK